MAIPPLSLIQAPTAAGGANLTKLSDAARLLLEPQLTPKDFLARLFESKLFKDAYSLLTIFLPQREVLWWAALCIRQSHGAVRSTQDEAALRAAVEWVLEPTAKTRQAALNAGMAAGKGSACGCLALAAGQAPAPLVPPKKARPAVPQAFVAARLARRAILLASVHGDPRVLGPLPEHFARLGLGVAAGEYTWKKLVVPATARDKKAKP